MSPMVTKKIALNMSRTGSISRSILRRARASAITAPRNSASVVFQPKCRPISKPIQIIKTISASPARANSAQFAQTECQPARKHQENHADLGEDIDGVLIGNQRRRRRVRTDDHTGHDVAEHDWLFETMKQHCDNAGDPHDDREIVDEFDGMHDCVIALAQEALLPTRGSGLLDDVSVTLRQYEIVRRRPPRAHVLHIDEKSDGALVDVFRAMRTQLSVSVS